MNTKRIEFKPSDEVPGKSSDDTKFIFFSEDEILKLFHVDYAILENPAILELQKIICLLSGIKYKPFNATTPFFLFDEIPMGTTFVDFLTKGNPDKQNMYWRFSSYDEIAVGKPCISLFINSDHTVGIQSSFAYFLIRNHWNGAHASLASNVIKFFRGAGSFNGIQVFESNESSNFFFAYYADDNAFIGANEGSLVVSSDLSLNNDLFYNTTKLFDSGKIILPTVSNLVNIPYGGIAWYDVNGEWKLFTKDPAGSIFEIPLM